MTVTLSELADVTVSDYDAIENLIRRGHLRTPLAETQRGAARLFTRANCLEVAFLAALIDVGRKPAVARATVADWMRKEAQGSLPHWWVENRATGQGTFLGSTSGTLTIERLANEAIFADDIGEGAMIDDENHGNDLAEIIPASRLAIINIAEIIRRIDRRFRDVE